MPKPTERALSIALPNKGRLSEPAVELLRKAGFPLDSSGSRRLLQSLWGGRVRVLYVRAQDIPELVQDGRADLGITGLDLIQESGARVNKITDLGFGTCRLVLAVPAKRGIRSVAQLPKGASIATSFPNITRAYLRKQRKTARVIPVSGATEVMPHIGVADAVVDLSATGSTLAANELVEIANLLESNAWLIANPDALTNGKSALVEEVRFALDAVLNARGKRYLMMDVPTKNLSRVRTVVPGIAGPTVMDIYGDPATKAVHVVVDEAKLYDVMRRLRALGARGMLVVPVERMVA